MHQPTTSSSICAWKRCMNLINRCATMRHLQATHALFITHGLSSNPFALSKLLVFCALSPAGDLSYAAALFRHHPHIRNSFFYNTLIRAYARTALPHFALRYFNCMVKDVSVEPDQYTFPFVLIACGNGMWVLEGRKVHCWVLKNGLGLRDVHVGSALLGFYCGCREMGDARKVFDEMPQRDVVQWNVLMSGYLRGGLVCEGLGVFREMMVGGSEPDEFCLTTALSACAQLGALLQGKWIHEYVKKRGDLVLDVFLGTALVDMYAKCGCIDMAVEVFNEMPKRNVRSWAAMIGGLAVHGYAREAISFLDRMQEIDGLMPDGVALLAVLMACTHAGYREEGLFLLENMEMKYRVAPGHEHYSCVVDMLCKAGRLDEAVEIIRRMPMKPLASVWGALLSGCRIHRNVELAELAVKQLQLLDDNSSADDGIYVELSNIYLAGQKRKEACRIRRMIGEKGIKKVPGCSMVEVDGQVNEFVSGDVAHPNLTAIHTLLGLLFFEFSHYSSETTILEEACT